MRLIISLSSLSSGETVLSGLLTSVLICSFSSPISSLRVSNTGELFCVPSELIRLMIFLSSEASLVFSRDIFLIASLISLMPVESSAILTVFLKFIFFKEQMFYVLVKEFN